MSGINDLPTDDLWSIIFQNLSIQDLFTCRLVNKKFKKFISSANLINKLIIGQISIYGDDFYDDLYWYYNNTPIKDEEIISLKYFREIKLRSIFNLDKYLKYLKIYDHQFELEELSNLINLESLEFSLYYRDYKQQILNSNNLKVIACNNSKLSIKLNEFKLEKIQFNNIDIIKLNGNPESIKHLITYNYDNRLKIFKNLEIIELRNTNQSVNENLLIIFKYLKQLKINLNSYSNYGYPDYSDGEIKNSLTKILNDKIELRREFHIYLEGVKIENIDKFSEFLEIEDSKWKFRFDNYDLLDLNLPFIRHLYYYELVECVNNIKTDLPLSFFDKFFNINCVGVSGRVNDIAGLNWFLNNFKYLTKLNIDYGEQLDELFFNNLPITIRHLSIEPDLDINYNFILNLPKLIEFYTYVDKNLFDLAFRAFLNLKYLKSFEFRYRDKYISIKKKEDNYYILNKNYGEKLDYNQLVEKCNLISSK